MKYFNLILFSCFLLCNNLVIAQDSTFNTKKVMKQFIIDLKTNGLLVRLDDQKKKIEALKTAGKLESADKLKLETEKYNKEIIKAFNDKFTFCPVYFTYRSNYQLASKPSSDIEIITIDSNLNEIKTDLIANSNFLIAEISDIQLDKASYYAENKEKYIGSDVSYEALIIKDKKLRQLTSPFPYYVRTLSSLPIARKTYKVVRKMNKLLVKYYEKVNDKVEEN